jgi:hypothetical protein
LLAPALDDLERCQNELRNSSFLADDPYRALLLSAEPRFREECLKECRGGNPDQVSLADLIELCPNGMLQPLSNFPTARSLYRGRLGHVVWKQAEAELELALRARWAAFAAEANCYPDVAVGGATRGAIVDKMLKDSISKAGFQPTPVSGASIKKWHPRSSWVDAAVGLMRYDDLQFVIATETPRPRKFKIFPEDTFEPAERDVNFDKITVSVWALCLRNISEIGPAAIKLKNVLLYYYWDFYSPKGLRRILDAHVAQARILLGRVS